MKKYTFLTYHKDYDFFLQKLREAGVVHIIEKQRANIFEDSQLYNWLNYGKRLNDTVKALNSLKKENEITDISPANKEINGIELLEQIEQIYSEKDKIVHKINAIKKEIEKILPWGYFEPESVKKLEKIGLYIHFHVVSQSKFNNKWIDEYNAIEISKINSNLYFLTITSKPDFPDIDTEHIKEFDRSVKSLNEELSGLEKDFDKINESLKQAVKSDLNTLLYTQNTISDNVDWEKAVLSSESQAEGKIIVLEGYVPVEKETEIEKVLKNEDVYYEVSEVAKNENAPILLKNNRFTRLFEVISNLYDNPSYHSYDLTLFYAPFYVMFFGLCVGDCGYGLLYLIISFFLGKSKNTFLKSVSKLVLWLGIGTVIFGFISGTFFGIPLSEQTWAWLDNFKIVMLDSNQLFYFALILGLIQLSFAWIIKIVTTTVRYGFVAALDTLGWIICVWGVIAVFLLSSQGIIPESLKGTLFTVIFIVGGLFMLLFNKPEKGIKGIPVSIGSGLWGLYNKVTGLLGDILSYIRLFALGISGAVLGLVFNQLAFSFAPDVIILKQLVIILILIFGHAVNLFLCSLSAFVHPMRLTFVEFYNNAGFEGGGIKYKPFKSVNNNN
ncbi:ATPase [Bacteroidales bacterium OttesenSCG-928-I21]|nr:ATPase [Bacteroidales bacterium OttesenSCG-928-I21]